MLGLGRHSLVPVLFVLSCQLIWSLFGLYKQIWNQSKESTKKGNKASEFNQSGIYFVWRTASQLTSDLRFTSGVSLPLTFDECPWVPHSKSQVEVEQRLMWLSMSYWGTKSDLNHLRSNWLLYENNYVLLRGLCFAWICPNTCHWQRFYAPRMHWDKATTCPLFTPILL